MSKPFLTRIGTVHPFVEEDGSQGYLLRDWGFLEGPPGADAWTPEELLEIYRTPFLWRVQLEQARFEQQALRRQEQ